MPVERNTNWGEPGRLPADGVVVSSNEEALELITARRRASAPLPVLGLLGGDLGRTLGATGDEARLRSAEATRFEIDLGAVLLDGRLHWFLAHLVARTTLWQGPVFAAMNADHLRRWNLAPRAHPGDGELDIVESTLGFTDRVRAYRRLPLGTHVPHPDIKIRRTDARQVSFDRPRRVWLDGVDRGRATDLSIRIEPAAVTVVV